mmetsp:Transcript_5823/g.13754  ORF Transcript_5823/g.13754 Transcript_5823/m.13754 type:complete len:231 (-) Transcript_5823:1231-1923(-)
MPSRGEVLIPVDDVVVTVVLVGEQPVVLQEADRSCDPRLLELDWVGVRARKDHQPGICGLFLQDLAANRLRHSLQPSLGAHRSRVGHGHKGNNGQLPKPGGEDHLANVSALTVHRCKGLLQESKVPLRLRNRRTEADHVARSSVHGDLLATTDPLALHPCLPRLLWGQPSPLAAQRCWCGSLRQPQHEVRHGTKELSGLEPDEARGAVVVLRGVKVDDHDRYTVPKRDAG